MVKTENVVEEETENAIVTYGVDDYGHTIYLSTFTQGCNGVQINELAEIVLKQHAEDCEKLDEIYNMLEEINEKLDVLMASSDSD